VANQSRHRMRSRLKLAVVVVVVVAVAGVLVAGVAGEPGTASTAFAAGPGSSQDSVRAASTAPPAWLAEINRYRQAAGLAPASDNTSWDAGLQNHLRYLALTPKQYLTGQYQSSHTENPASPYYTSAGAHEAGSSDLVQGAVRRSPVQVIDGWFEAPFHAVGILRPGLAQVAFAYDPSTGDGGLDIISGLNSSTPRPSTPTLFPANGMTTNMNVFGGELPDPLQTCGWSGRAVGLPLIAMLPSAPASGLAASVVTPDGGVESSANGQLCVVDSNTYHSSDPVYGPTGAGILSGDHAVLLIPAEPLTPGRYSAVFRASITQPGRPNIAWSFSDFPPLPGTASGMAVTRDGHGYWLTDGAGQVSIHGDAPYLGSAIGAHPASPIRQMAASPDGGGYWLLGGDGGIFTFGDAHFYGSTGNRRLNQPVVGMAPTADGRGYWLVASDGGIFSFGDARFHGSTGNIRLNRPVVGMAPTADGRGYWLVASDGGIFSFGDARFHGSTGNIWLNQPIVGMTRSASGGGYRLVASDGGLFSFGDATFYGSLGGMALSAPIISSAASADKAGYYMVGADGTVYAFGDAVYQGSD
jgi:hypothetical protein